MNQRQAVFIRRALQKLKRVIEKCASRSATAREMIGQKKLGKHTIIVHIVAEVDKGFEAPLSSHASISGIHPKPDYSKKTEHHNKQRTSRWHKPHF